jgi:serine-type D-Ala-D-Ala carboxypeptidase/endopeptidase (penicillin-binding protein 4)
VQTISRLSNIAGIILLNLVITPSALATPESLPQSVEAALTNAHVARTDISVFVQDVNASEPLIAIGEQEARNPASTMKLLTTLAGLELLGPAFRWKTDVFVTGTLRGDVLEGNIYVKGHGDPDLTLERFTALLHEVRQHGIREINGDIVLDRSHFDIPDDLPQSFDNHPNETYNTPPDALLIGLNSVLLKITPSADRTRKATLTVSSEPKLPQLQLINELRPLAIPCRGGRISLGPRSIKARGHNLTPRSRHPTPAKHSRKTIHGKQSRVHQVIAKHSHGKHKGSHRNRRGPRLVFIRARPHIRVSSDRNHGTVKFSGYYPLGCGASTYVTKVLGPVQFAYGAFIDSWARVGGSIHGGLRLAPVPNDARLVASLESEPLADIVHVINKQSNNPMARQLFLSLGNHKIPPPATTTKADHAIREWLSGQGMNFNSLVLENGSGLSHTERISASEMGRLLLHAYHSNAADAFLTSLPIVSVDGTMRHRLRYQPVAGHAQIKTGSLRGVKAIAGYVHDRQGRTLAVVFIANRPGAGVVVRAQDELLEWLYERT